MTKQQPLTIEEFVNIELRDTVTMIDSIIIRCWKLTSAENTPNNQERHNWMSLAKDACTLKADILTNTSFLKTARAAAIAKSIKGEDQTETKEEEEYEAD